MKFIQFIQRGLASMVYKFFDKNSTGINIPSKFN